MVATLVATLVTALVCAGPVSAQTQPTDSVMAARPVWDDDVAKDYVARATQRRRIQLADSTLLNYEATARGFLAFLAQLGEGFTDPPRVVQTEQLALRVSWWQPDRSAQQLVGRRDTTLMPASVGYYRDRYGVVLDNLPDRIRLGDGYDVADVPHPLAPGADSLYEFKRGDAFSMRLPDREVMVDEVLFRPRNVNAARAIGSVYLDRETSAVVRLQLTFTRAAILDKRIEALAVTLENSLVRGRYWLPRRQEVEVVRRSTWLDVPARGIVRGHWDVSGYSVNEGVSTQTLMLPAWSSVSRDSLSNYAFEGTVTDALPPDMQVARDDDVRSAQQIAENAVRASALTRATSIAASGTGVSDFIRHSRVEGLGLGAGVSYRSRSATTFRVNARYGLDDRQVKGRVSLDRRPAMGGAPTMQLFAERQYRTLGAPERAGVTNSLASLLFGSDFTSPVDVRAAGVQVRAGTKSPLTLRLAYEQEDSLAVVARPVSGTFAPVRPAWSLRGVRADLIQRRLFGETGERQSVLEWRAIASASRGLDVAGVRVNARALRLESDAQVQWPMAGARQLVLSARAGVTVGENIPPQWLQLAGGPWSGPGYAFHALAGRQLFSPRVEWRVPVPFPSISLGKYGASPARMQLIPFAQAVVLGGTSDNARTSPLRDGVYPSVGVGALLFYDLLRVDVSRGLRQGTWQFAIDVDRMFWGIL